MMKRCTCCRVAKPTTDFSRDGSRGDGLNAYCRPCLADKGKRNRAELRARVLTKLGDECVRCHFADARALQIDHVNGHGRAEREAIGNPRKFLLRVLADETGAYQLLCANCNQIKKAEMDETDSRWKNQPVTITIA